MSSAICNLSSLKDDLADYDDLIDDFEGVAETISNAVEANGVWNKFILDRCWHSLWTNFDCEFDQKIGRTNIFYMHIYLE